MFEGKDLVALAMRHVGEKYVLGASVPLSNAKWRGPWDCAEFLSWCVFHAYGITFAVRPPNINSGESFSGWWHEDAVKQKLIVPLNQAFATPGMILVRRPGDFGVKIGHVAISRGDGTTIEAHSSKVGVAVRTEVSGRSWTEGVRMAGVTYAAGAAVAAHAPAFRFVMVTDPFEQSERVKTIQRALAAHGVDPGDVDGVFGPATHKAVAAFQMLEGLVHDGVVGPDTAEALGLQADDLRP